VRICAVAQAHELAHARICAVALVESAFLSQILDVKGARYLNSQQLCAFIEFLHKDFDDDSVHNAMNNALLVMIKQSFLGYL
jgi:hypothetical protein